MVAAFSKCRNRPERSAATDTRHCGDFGPFEETPQPDAATGNPWLRQIFSKILQKISMPQPMPQPAFLMMSPKAPRNEGRKRHREANPNGAKTQRPGTKTVE